MMRMILPLFAAKIWTPPTFWSLIALGAVIVVGIPIIIHLRREAKETPLTDEEQLAQFQEAYDAGEMDEAEFRRVRALLRGRMIEKYAGDQAEPLPDAPPDRTTPPPDREDPSPPSEPT